MNDVTAAVDPSLTLEMATKDLLDQVDQHPRQARLSAGVVDPQEYGGTLVAHYRTEAAMGAIIRRSLDVSDPLIGRLDGLVRLEQDLQALAVPKPTKSPGANDRFQSEEAFALGALWVLWFRYRKDPGLVRRIVKAVPTLPTNYLTVLEDDIDRFWLLQKRLAAVCLDHAIAGGRFALAVHLEHIHARY